MKIAVGIALAAACATSSPAQAQSGEQMAKSICGNCHSLVKEKALNSLRRVIAPHKGQPGADARLVTMLRDGKLGDHFHPTIKATDAELKAAVDFALKF